MSRHRLTSMMSRRPMLLMIWNRKTDDAQAAQEIEHCTFHSLIQSSSLKDCLNFGSDKSLLL